MIAEHDGAVAGQVEHAIRAEGQLQPVLRLGRVTLHHVLGELHSGGDWMV